MVDLDVRENELQDESLSGGEDQLLGISSDLIRGHINTIILRTLYDEDKYGYDIMDEIERKSGGLYKLKPPTLYSALKRLESLGYVDSYAGEFSNGGRRKYFHLTDAGKEIAKRNLSEWEFSRTIIDSLISDGDNHYDFSFIAEKQQELEELKRSLAAREAAIEEEKAALAGLKNELQRERSLLATQNADLAYKKNDLGEFNEKIRSQKEELEAKELALSEKQGELDAKELALQEKQKELDQARNTIQILSTELSTASQQLNEYKSTAEAQAEELQETENALLSLQQEYSAMRLELSALKEQAESTADNEELERLKTELLEKEEQLSTAEKALEEKVADLEKRETALAAAQIELSEKSGEYYELLSKVTSEQARLETERAEFESLKSTSTESEAELLALKSEYENTQLALEEKTEAINYLQSLISSQEESLRILRDALDRKSEENEQELGKINALKTEIEEKTATLEVAKEELALREQALTESRNAFEEERNTWQTEKDALVAQIDTIEEQKRQLEDQKAILSNLQAELAQKEREFNERELSFGNDQSRTTADREELEKSQAKLTEQQDQLKRLNDQLRFEQELMKQQQAELTTRLELFNQQQLDYLARKQALTLQQFEYDDNCATQAAKMQHFSDSLAAFEAEKAEFAVKKEMFDEQVKAFESEKAHYAEEKGKAYDANRVFIDSLTIKQEELRKEEARLQALSADLDRRSAELHAMRYTPGYNMRTPAVDPAYRETNNAPYANASTIPMDELQKRAERDGIRLNSRSTNNVSSYSGGYPIKEAKPTQTFNKGATLFKSALFTFCFLAIECIITLFLKDKLTASILYPLIPLALGLIGFAVCSVLYARGYQPNARLNKKSATYIFTATILFIVGIIISSMVAVYCRAPLEEPAAFFKFIIVPAIFLTNIILFPTFYHFLSLSMAAKNEQNVEEAQ